MTIKAGFVKNLGQNSKYHQSISLICFITYCFKWIYMNY
jgi:hypothetical protein